MQLNWGSQRKEYPIDWRNSNVSALLNIIFYVRRRKSNGASNGKLDRRVMAKVTVRLYSLFRQLTQMDYIDLEANNLGEAVKQLELRFGPQFQERLRAFRIRQDVRLQEYCIFLLNGRSVNKEELDRVELKTGDILHVFPFAAGG